MKLEEGQVWELKNGSYVRIQRRERLSVEYKVLKDLKKKEGSVHELPKKEFCRLLNGAVLLTPEQVRELKGVVPRDSEMAEDEMENFDEL